MIDKNLGKSILVSVALVLLSSACKLTTSEPESLWGGKEHTPEIQLIKAKDAVSRAEGMALAKVPCKEVRALVELAGALSQVTEEQGQGEITKIINDSEALEAYLKGSLFLNVFDNDVTLISFNLEDMARAVIGTSFVTLDSTGMAQSKLQLLAPGSFQWDSFKTKNRIVGRWSVVEGNDGEKLISLIVENSGQDYKNGVLGNIDVKLPLQQEITKLGFTGNYLLGSSSSTVSFVNFAKKCNKS